jgi:hypothetical protein
MRLFLAADMRDADLSGDINLVVEIDLFDYLAYNLLRVGTVVYREVRLIPESLTVGPQYSAKIEWNVPIHR